MWNWLVYDLRAERPETAAPTARRGLALQVAGGIVLTLAVGFGLGFAYGSREAASAVPPMPTSGPVPLAVQAPAAVEGAPSLVAPEAVVEVSASADPAGSVPNEKS